MIVIVLTATPAGLRGFLTRWFLEISPGVFVGQATARVRDRAWLRIVEMVGRGRAILVYSTTGEQRLAFRVHGHDWSPVDFDGIQLMLRPTAESTGHAPGRSAPDGWSTTSRRRRFGRRTSGGSAD